jgi:hypothetical protein
MKTLKQLNNKIIVDQFGDLDNFYNKLNELASLLPADEKLLIDEIRIYYNDLFELEDMSIEKDLRKIEGVVRENLETLKGIKIKSAVLDTVISMFEQNLDTLKDVHFINRS